MIQSRPKGTTLFSLILFLIIAYGVGFWAWFSIPPSPAIWLALPVFCLATALVITLKVLLGYRVISINGDQWQVVRLLRQDQKFRGKEIEWWREIEIKTAGGQYKQLQVHAGKGVDAKVSLQEHTGYEGILKRLKTKHRHKELKDI